MCSDTVFPIQTVREDFPILSSRVHGQRLVYLDNAATSQTPRQVIEAIESYYHTSNANVHRGVHYLSEKATALYEGARQKITDFINASSTRECIYTRGTTESINLVANSFVLPRLKAGDEVLVTHLEHHSNIVPWQLVCEKIGAKVVAVPINQHGEVQLGEFAKLISDKTRFISVNHVSNALGTINPIKAMIALAKDNDIPIMIDGAQAAPHLEIDVQALDCDFYAFSGHKMYGPTGIGVLWGRETLLGSMPPYMGGGDMILQVSFDKSAYAPLPAKFEAGTPNIAGAIGLGAAIDYIDSIGLQDIAAYEHELLSYANDALSSLDGFQIIGTAKEKASVLSFVHEHIHPHDMGTILDAKGIAIRSGHHCAMPVMDFFDVPATTRASFALYNTFEEVDVLIEGLKNVVKVFS